MDRLGLRFILYIANCPQHSLEIFTKNFGTKNELYTGRIGDVLEICEQLKKVKCIGYSSMIVLLNTHCKCRSKMLRIVMKAFKNNHYLKYKSKLIIASYVAKIDYRYAWNEDMAKVLLIKYFEELENQQLNSSSNTLIYPDLKQLENEDDYIRKLLKKYWNEREQNTLYNDTIKNITKDNKTLLKDFNYFQQKGLDNTIFMQNFFEDELELMSDVERIVNVVIENIATTTMQQILIRHCQDTSKNYILQSSSSKDLYFLSLNPSLAIIINNRDFSNDLGNREGSEKDVEHLTKILQLNGIPFSYVEDCDRISMLTLMNYVQNLDCSALKNFLLFIMSHGGANGIIYAKDGEEININTDIIKPIQSNATLKDTEKVIVILACRGDIDPEYADLDDLERIHPTTSENLSNNTTIIYSTPNNVMSIRCPKHGSPFMTSLCKHASKYNDLKDIVQRIDEDLRQESCFSDLEQVPELITKNPDEQHHIQKEYGDVPKMMKFIETVSTNFPHRSVPGRHGADKFCLNVPETLTSALDDDQYSTISTISSIGACRTECANTTH